MGKYDEAAKQTTAAVNAQLAQEKERLLGYDVTKIAKLLPDAGDRAKLEKLIAEVKAATSENEAAQAYREFASSATEAGVKAVGQAFKIASKLVL